MKRLSIRLKPDSSVDLWRQLYQQLQKLIRAGQLKPGEALAPTRKMAEQLKVSRKTVRLAYEQLVNEGYLESRIGSGTFVNLDLEEHQKMLSEPAENGKKAASDKAGKTHLSIYGKAIANIDIEQAGNSTKAMSFFNWQPAFSRIPSTHGSEILMREYLRAQRSAAKRTGDPQGYAPLCQAIAQALTRLRKVKCTAQQVIVTSGLQQAVDLVARMHAGPGDLVAFEDPCYVPIRDSFEANGARIMPVAIDEQGLMVDSLLASKEAKKVKLVYVSPSHQFPTGASMPLARQLKLLEWSRKNGALILEDDYDSEFGYGDYPRPAMQGIDTSQSVIYFGTFTKVLFAPFSVGYLIVPPRLVELYDRGVTLICDPLPEELLSTLATFIQKGHLERHIKRIELLYKKRRERLLSALTQLLDSSVEILGHTSGLHVLIRIKSKSSDKEIIERSRASGLGLVSTQPFYYRKRTRGEFVFGYADLTEEMIDEGVKRLRRVLTTA